MAILSRSNRRRFAIITDTPNGVLVEEFLHYGHQPKLVKAGIINAPFHWVLDHVHEELN